ncbi:MAG: hypothetical protein ACT4O2_13880 [Beijerinckiaceae bacterium]
MRLRTQRVQALTMGRFRQGSIARRAAISALALYALLLQGFLAASAPAAAFAFPGGVTCAQDGSGSGAPGSDPVHHHKGLCCILACAAAACAYVATASAVPVFSARAASTIDFPPVPGLAARAPHKYYFGARGPPKDL